MTVPNVDMSAGKLDFNALGTSDVWVALITFLYLDFLDATSTSEYYTRSFPSVKPRPFPVHSNHLLSMTIAREG